MFCRSPVIPLDSSNPFIMTLRVFWDIVKGNLCIWDLLLSQPTAQQIDGILQFGPQDGAATTVWRHMKQWIGDPQVASRIGPIAVKCRRTRLWSGIGSPKLSRLWPRIGCQIWLGFGCADMGRLRPRTGIFLPNYGVIWTSLFECWELWVGLVLFCRAYFNK